MKEKLKQFVDSKIFKYLINTFWVFYFTCAFVFFDVKFMWIFNPVIPQSRGFGNSISYKIIELYIDNPDRPILIIVLGFTIFSWLYIYIMPFLIFIRKFIFKSKIPIIWWLSIIIEIVFFSLL